MTSISQTMNWVSRQTIAASSYGWIERDNIVAIVAAFKLVLLLTRSLAAATPGFPRTQSTFEGGGDATAFDKDINPIQALSILLSFCLPRGEFLNLRRDGKTQIWDPA